MKEKKMIKFILGYIYTQIQTTKHRFWVFWYLSKFCFKLLWRGSVHDLDKYRWKEAKHFAKTIFDLKSSTYGSDEYKKLLEEIEPALKHHYSRNKHHPEFHSQYVDMNIMDKIEMVCDWKAATRRHADGDINKSIEINQKRFGYTDEEKKLLIAIVKQIDKKT